MQTCFLADESEDLPISCTIAVHQTARLMAGTIWGLCPPSLSRGKLNFLLLPMFVSLSLHLSATMQVRLVAGRVTWARAKEYGIAFSRSSASTCCWRNLDCWKEGRMLPFQFNRITGQSQVVEGKRVDLGGGLITIVDANGQPRITFEQAERSSWWRITERDH